jgi:hypothetical protein
MPTTTITADSVAYATTSSLVGQPLAKCFVGHYASDSYASAIRFEIPAIATIAEAILHISGVSLSGSVFSSTLSVKPSSQTLPTTPIGSGWTTYSFDIPISTSVTSVDVTELLQEALADDLLDGAVCFLWLDDGSDDSLFQFDGIDASLEPDIIQPTLYLDYTLPSPPPTIEGELLIDVESIVFEADAYAPQQFGSLSIAVESIELEADATVAMTGLVDLLVESINLRIAGNVPSLGSLAIDVESIDFAIGESPSGQLTIDVNDVLVALTGQRQYLGSLSIGVDDVLTAMSGSSATGRMSGLFDDSLFPSGLFVG